MEKIKAIIEIGEKGLASIDFKKGNKIVSWDDLEKTEQAKILNSFTTFHELFYKFFKQ